MVQDINGSLHLAQRIIDLFDEAGVTEAERYRVLKIVTALIPGSYHPLTDGAASERAAPDAARSAQEVP